MLASHLYKEETLMNCPMCDMMGGGMGLGMILMGLIGVALLMLLVVAIIGLWPRRGATFQSSEPNVEDGDLPDGRS